MDEVEELNVECGIFLMEVEMSKYRAGDEDLGAVAWVLHLAKAFERVSLPVVWVWATHFSFPRKILRVLYGYFEHQRRVQFEGCVGGAAPDPAICQGQSGGASAYCTAGCIK